MNKRKICVPIIVLMASLLAWTGCEKEPQKPETEALTSGKGAQQQRIIFEYYFHEFMWNAIETSVRAFNQRHPDLRLDNVALDHESDPAEHHLLHQQRHALQVITDALRQFFIVSHSWLPFFQSPVAFQFNGPMVQFFRPLFK